ncbi:hypothetical protein HK097_011355 [Rhizophlyctis rosea]|uniref:Peptidase M12B domain-containing protein n=1 Tax=Rhizophlyctis rosea TaxID=64517 RepID=A0AAD5S8V5_9FUNG|nr:hypothetical protein HK097_011355 [Rhizophlyctis rosea]
MSYLRQSYIFLLACLCLLNVVQAALIPNTVLRRRQLSDIFDHVELVDDTFVPPEGLQRRSLNGNDQVIYIPYRGATLELNLNTHTSLFAADYTPPSDTQFLTGTITGFLSSVVRVTLYPSGVLEGTAYISGSLGAIHLERANKFGKDGKMLVYHSEDVKERRGLMKRQETQSEVDKQAALDKLLGALGEAVEVLKQLNSAGPAGNATTTTTTSPKATATVPKATGAPKSTGEAGEKETAEEDDKPKSAEPSKTSVRPGKATEAREEPTFQPTVKVVTTVIKVIPAPTDLPVETPTPVLTPKETEVAKPTALPSSRAKSATAPTLSPSQPKSSTPTSLPPAKVPISPEPQPTNPNLITCSLALISTPSFTTHHSDAIPYMLSLISSISLTFENQLGINLQVAQTHVLTSKNTTYATPLRAMDANVGIDYANNLAGSIAEIKNSAKDLCAVFVFTSEPFQSPTIGIAYTTSLCVPDKFATSATDLNSAFTFSEYSSVVLHELGHVFGSPHDTDPEIQDEKCREGKDKFTMYPAIQKNSRNAHKFSECSVGMIKSNLRSKRGDRRCWTGGVQNVEGEVEELVEEKGIVLAVD